MKKSRLLAPLVLLAALASAPCATAEIKVAIDPQQRLSVSWDGHPVVLPSRPEVRSVGGGRRTVFNPVSREHDTIEMTAAQGIYLVVYNKKRQQVFLGDPQRTQRLENGVAIYREEFPQAGTWWEARVEPVDGNGIDIVLNVGTAPHYWLANFEVKLFDLALGDAKGDTGDLRAHGRERDPVTGAIRLPATGGDLRIGYPSGPSMFVPAAVLQDDRLAVGVTLLGAHEVWRPAYGELAL